MFVELEAGAFPILVSAGNPRLWLKAGRGIRLLNVGGLTTEYLRLWLCLGGEISIAVPARDAAQHRLGQTLSINDIPEERLKAPPNSYAADKRTSMPLYHLQISMQSE